MTLFDYLAIILSLGLFGPLNFLILGYGNKVLRRIGNDKFIWDYSHVSEINFKNIKSLKSWIPVTIILIISFLAFDIISWAELVPSYPLKAFILIVSGVITWKSVTLDIDIASNKKQIAERSLLFLAFIGTFFYPTFTLIIIYTTINCFRGYTHHAHLAIRTLMVFNAFLLSKCILILALHFSPFKDGTISILPLYFLILCFTASHYFIPAVRKFSLGPHWYSWIKENHLHFISISAYMWGWLRWIPQKTYITFINKIKAFDPFSQLLVLLIEGGTIFMAWHQDIACIYLLAIPGLHLAIYLLSGICFWENFIIELSLCFVIWQIPSSIATQLFNLKNEILFASIIIIFPLRGYILDIPSLAWWDTPYACRIHWEVVGTSGKKYGLYNDFMSPHERVFGNTFSFRLINSNLIAEHLGETNTLKNAQQIIASKGNKEILSQLKSFNGKSFYSKDCELFHDLWITAFFKHLNAKEKKQICPKWLRAPGELHFYWGLLEAYDYQEPVKTVRLIYREEFFNGETCLLVNEKLVRELII